MNHLLLLYYFISLAVGLFSLGCFFTILKSNKNEIIKLFLVCYGLFCLFILSTAVKMFADLYLIDYKDLVGYILPSAQFFGLIFSMYTITYLINKIHLVPFSKRLNTIFFVFSAAMWIFCALRDTGIIDVSSVPYLDLLDDELYYGLMTLYNFTIYFIYRKNIENKRLYKALRATFIISMLFIPGFVFDELVSPSGRILIFTPSFFMIISIFSLYSFFKVNELIQTERYVIPEGIKKKLGITERESEVFNLLLKGYSYNKIGAELIISISTVRAHVSNIYRKAGVNSRFELYNLINP